MGTKNNPGKYDCFANAEPDEPMFVLLGRDPTASVVVTFWRDLKASLVREGKSASSKEKLEEASACAAAMEAYARERGKDVDAALFIAGPEPLKCAAARPAAVMRIAYLEAGLRSLAEHHEAEAEREEDAAEDAETAKDKAAKLLGKAQARRLIAGKLRNLLAGELL